MGRRNRERVERIRAGTEAPLFPPAAGRKVALEAARGDRVAKMLSMRRPIKKVANERL